MYHITLPENFSMSFAEIDWLIDTSTPFDTPSKNIILYMSAEQHEKYKKLLQAIGSEEDGNDYDGIPIKLAPWQP